MISSLKSEHATKHAKRRVADAAAEDEGSAGKRSRDQAEDDDGAQCGCYRKHNRNCFTDFIVWRPIVFLCITVVIPVILVSISMQYFSLNDLDGWEVRFGDLTLQHNAFEAAQGATDEFERESASASRSRALADGDNVLRIDDSGGWLQVFFENKAVACGQPEGSFMENILTAAGVQMMIEVEQEVFESVEYQEYCQLDADGACTGYSSLVQFYLSDAGYSSVMDIQDPRGESDDALEAIVTHLRAGEGSSFMESEFDFPAIADPAAPVVADVVRSYFYFGLPLAGYEGYESDADAANQKETQQDIILEKAVQPIGELLYPRWNDAAAAETCDRVFFSLSGVNSYFAMRTLTSDAVFAGGSFVFVGIFVSFHTRSAVLGILGILQVLLSFPMAFFLYRLVFQIQHFGTLQILAIYVILGIGADDIFVFYDAWKQAALLPPPIGFGSREIADDYEQRQSCCFSGTIRLCRSREENIEFHDGIPAGKQYDPRARLGHSFKTAATAMLATSTTTFVSFIVTAFSPILNIQVFGIFASLLVLWNFILVITFFPTLLLLHEHFCMCACTRCCRNGRCACPDKDAEFKSLIAVKENVSPGSKNSLPVAQPSKTQPNDSKEAALEIEMVALATVAVAERQTASVEEYRAAIESHVAAGRASEQQRAEAIVAADASGCAPCSTEAQFKYPLVCTGCNYSEAAKADDHAHESTGCFTECVRYGYAPWLWNYRWLVLVFYVAVAAAAAGLASQIGPSDKSIADIWPEDHMLTREGIASTSEFLDAEFSFIFVNFVWGINPMDPTEVAGFDPEHKGEFSFDESFDIDPVASQEHLEFACSELSEQAVLSSVICFLDTFKAYLGFNGLGFPVEPSTANGNRTFSQLLRQWADDPNFGGPQLLSSHTFGFDDDNHVAFIAIIAQSNVTWNDPVTERVTVYDHLVEAVDDLNAAAPSTMNNLLQASYGWVWMATAQALVQGSYVGLGISLGCAAAVVFFSTRFSFSTALAATLSMGAVAACVVACMYLAGWGLGFMESICMTVLVGLAVDYSMHLAVAFIDSPHSHVRRVRTVEAMAHIAISIVGGAISTLGSSFFLFFCTITYLSKFGYFLFMTIGFSLFFALGLYPVLLMFLGPPFGKRRRSHLCCDIPVKDDPHL